MARLNLILDIPITRVGVRTLVSVHQVWRVKLKGNCEINFEREIKMGKRVNSSFRFLGFIAVILMLASLSGCSGTNQLWHDGPGVILTYTHPRGSPLRYQFTVQYGGLTDSDNNDYIQLYITPGSGGYSYATWTLHQISGSGDHSGTAGPIDYFFPSSNPSPTTYTVYAQLVRPSENYKVVAYDGPYSITVTNNKFNIIQVQMTNDDLWPSYTSSPYYYGTTQRDAAFGDANTSIVVKKNITGVSNTTNPDGSSLDLSSDLKIEQYGVWEAYGVRNPLNLDSKVGILCGIDDVTGGLLPNPSGGLIGGYTVFYSDHSYPPVSCVLYSRVRSFYSGYNMVRVLTGSAIHELGHAIGIEGDDPNITHGGNHENDCVMHSKLGPDNYTDVYFCDAHLTQLKAFDWFWE